MRIYTWVYGYNTICVRARARRESNLLTRTYLPASMEVKDNNTAARIYTTTVAGKVGGAGATARVWQSTVNRSIIIIIIHNTYNIYNTIRPFPNQLNYGCSSTRMTALKWIITNRVQYKIVLTHCPRVVTALRPTRPCARCRYTVCVYALYTHKPGAQTQELHPSKYSTVDGKWREGYPWRPWSLARQAGPRRSSPCRWKSIKGVSVWMWNLLPSPILVAHAHQILCRRTSWIIFISNYW
jgi:hypothetical protein